MMMCEERRNTVSDHVVDDVDDESGKSLATIPKLRIKIKLPKMSCDDDDDRIRKVADADDDVDKEYACLLCRKGFPSGKALGGHMRVHAHHQRPNDVASFVTELEIAEDFDKDMIRCPICERDFPSNKALFGHMRCHPERSWRGIQPPPARPVYYNTTSSSTVSDVNQPPTDGVVDDIADEKLRVIDLEKDLLPFGWVVKSIRGRVSITTKSYSSSSAAADEANVEPEEVDGVQSLILLSLGDNNGPKLQNSTTSLRTDVCKVDIDNNANYMMMNKNLKYQSETIRGTKRKSYSDLLTSQDREQYQIS